MSGKGVCRYGDINEKKARLEKGCAETVLVNGKKTGIKSKANVVKHPGQNPKKPHPMNPIAKGDDTVLVEKMPIAFKGTIDQCKHKMIKASEDVLVKG